ncbi:MAG TPA: M20/M25/M40 family metallo-hydrolase [Candidatus Binataceae bacterium]|nr:M20/M25/M40 family metallo-hydrolase [Candidatus Binataceae bacterium]
MDTTALRTHVEQLWDRSILGELTEYIRIPNKSPAFDPEWQAHGHMERAAARFADWARRHAPAGATVEIVRLEGRTPVLFIDVPGSSADCILLYGHMDKQPEMTGWGEGLGPWEPVVRGERLYGRGASDDGYAMFAALAALGALRAQSVAHARCAILIESCEESGSYDLPHYIDHLAGRIGSPSLVIALDSGCASYDQLWCTTSLRGLAGGTLTVEVLSEGVHSGDAGGVVPDSFRIVRQLLSRIEDETTGAVTQREFHAEIPAARREQAQAAAAALGSSWYERFPFVAGARPLSSDPAELILNRTWRPALAVIGADGLPPLASAGNVMRPMTALKLSLRLPPTCDAEVAAQRLKTLLEHDPPHGARVSFVPNWAANGWDAPALAPWLGRSMEEASRAYFGAPPAFMGEGGTIPFTNMLGERFPDAQFLVTGVLGPHSNAHGPNEFLHIPTAKRVTCCVAKVIADHFRRRGG